MEKLTKLKKVKRKRKHGFLSMMKSHSSSKIIKRRKSKGRKRISI